MNAPEWLNNYLIRKATITKVGDKIVVEWILENDNCNLSPDKYSLLKKPCKS